MTVRVLLVRANGYLMPQNASGNSSLVCLPTYNERENLSSLVEEVLATAPVDVLVIDDNSPDGTGRVAELLAEKNPGRVFVLHRSGKLGLGTAYLAGFRFGLDRGYARLLEMDADFSHQPRYLPTLLEVAERADLVLGSRYVDGGGVVNWSLPRQLLSRSGSVYARAILDLPFRDLTSGYKCFRREVLEAIDLPRVKTTGYAFQIELTHRAYCKGFQIEEVPIVFFERQQGTSKMTLRIVEEALRSVWTMRAYGRLKK
jgi:dolichol-phosphate mannosyltransferase